MTAAVESYIALRRSLGFKLVRVARWLKDFAAFAIARGSSHLRTADAIDWAGRSASPYQRSCRLKVVAAFARHLRAEDSRHEVLPANHFRFKRQRRTPTLYTLEDTGRLIAAARRLGPRGSLRPHVYATLFGLLACTGLRLGEALRLRFADLSPDGLLIHHTKFNKTRLVPLHKTAAAALSVYLVRRRRVAALTDHLFVSLAGRQIQPGKVDHVFLALARSISLRAGPGTRGVRLHDFRHTFAVRSLEACSSDRERVGRHLVALSTYLGHADVSDTYWYLTATPQLFRSIASACEAIFPGGAS